ncbi:hypothetical protein [Kitasatospora viridis]|uniref:Uncharacterized protein n=1 Tax=Kitasatospora viridis TaxID=281105 RepID=A0A561UKP7_9ACTN|nr:hypothetical protein [Kitasatospora viridis]TWF99934.1 hypothetical protein FHX73_113794 [Kitasatospora viridis]
MSDRAQYTAALRQVADWLDANPHCNLPVVQGLHVPLHTNAAVREFAQQLGLETDADAEGNLSINVPFGPINYHAYGYVNFDDHCAATEERNARRWADKNGLQITAGTDG